MIIQQIRNDEAVFIEDSDTVTIHDVESGYTKRLPVSDVFYNDPKIDTHKGITSRDTLNILADAISDVGSWWCWHVGDNMLQLEFCDVQLYDETKGQYPEGKNLCVHGCDQPCQGTRTGSYR